MVSILSKGFGNITGARSLPVRPRSCPGMNSQNPVDVAMAFVTKINEHDVDGLVALMTPDHVFVDALNTTFRGADRMRQGWKGYFAMFPDYAIEVIDEADRGN